MHIKFDLCPIIQLSRKRKYLLLEHLISTIKKLGKIQLHRQQDANLQNWRIYSLNFVVSNL